MKYFFAVFILGIIIAGCSGSHKSQKYLGLKGKVISVKDSHHHAKEKAGETVPGYLQYILVHSFDNEGNSIGTNFYYENSDCISEEEQKYENGEWIGASFKNNESGEHRVQKRVSLVEADDIIQTVWDEQDMVNNTNRTIVLNIDKDYGHSCWFVKDENDNEVLKQDTWFDSRMNKIEIKLSIAGQLSSHIKSTFNEQNEETDRFENFSGRENNFKYVYRKYDETGNWTEKLTLVDEKVEAITLREILYVRD